MVCFLNNCGANGSLLNCRALYNSNANGVTPYAVERAILTCSSAAVTDFIVERSPKSMDRLELDPWRHGGTKSVLHVLSSIAKFPGHGFRLEVKGFSRGKGFVDVFHANRQKQSNVMEKFEHLSP